MVERGGKGQSGDLPLSGGSRILGTEIVELASRSSGPGGQHVNTSSTRVTLRWNLRESHGIGPDAKIRLLARLRGKLSREGVLIVHSDRSRSRQRNREVARARLHEIVETALYQEPPRRPTVPTRASKRRRVEAKRIRGKIKDQRRNRDDDGH